MPPCTSPPPPLSCKCEALALTCLSISDPHTTTRNPPISGGEAQDLPLDPRPFVSSKTLPATTDAFKLSRGLLYTDALLRFMLTCLRNLPTAITPPTLDRVVHLLTLQVCLPCVKPSLSPTPISTSDSNSNAAPLSAATPL